MRARIPAETKVSNKTRLAIRELVAKEHEKAKHCTTRRIMKIFCVTINETFGFGKGRLSRLLNNVYEITNEHAEDEIFWAKVDRKLKQIGLDFQDEEWEL